jgi:hypothetical protein
MEEVIDLPIAQRMAVAKDCLLDIIASSEDVKTCASSQDLMLITKAAVSASFIIEPESERIQFIQDLQNYAEVLVLSASIEGTERLMNALKFEAASEKSVKPILVVSRNILAVRVPAVDKENPGQIDNLGKYLKWASLLLGLNKPTIRITYDSSLGKDILLPARLGRMMDNTIAALTLTASESGDKAEFKSGLKANLVELLAAIKLMRKYSGSLQRGVAAKGQKAQITTLEMLRASVNGRSGCNEHGVTGFPPQFVKAIFNEMTKPNSSSFPGQWIHSLKVSNGTKNNIGIVYRLGYETKCPNPQKVLQVVRTGVREKAPEKEATQKPKGSKKDPKGKKLEVYPLTSENIPNGISHREFRLAALCLLPLIDPKDKRSPKDQLSQDPLLVRDKTILGFYSKHRKCVDTLNLAYATKAALSRKDSKATPGGYKSARGHAIRLSANCEFMDASGKYYQKFMDVPETTRNFLLKLCNRKLAEPSEDSDDEPDEEEEEPTKEGSAENLA